MKNLQRGLKKEKKGFYLAVWRLESDGHKVVYL